MRLVRPAVTQNAEDEPDHHQPARNEEEVEESEWSEVMLGTRGRLRSAPSRRRCPLPGTGFIDHIGIGVPDLVAAKQYYDELMAVLGLREWFETGSEGPLNYGPDGALGSQLFFYQAEEPGTYSRGKTGLHHLAFLVESRAVVREAHRWACAREAVILDEPREFPQYGEHCFATYWLDPHGFKLEAVCHSPEAATRDQRGP